MNKTNQSLDPQANKKSNNENKARAAAAGIGAVAGAAAGFAASAAMGDSDDAPVVEAEEVVEVADNEPAAPAQPEPQAAAPAQPEPQAAAEPAAPAQEPSHQPQPSSQAQPQPEPAVEPQPEPAVEPEPEPAVEPVVEEVVVDEEIITDPIDDIIIEEPMVEEPVITQADVLTDESEIHVEEDVIEGVNPDEIAQAVISEDQIDPNDLETADVFNFEEIGTVYTVDGEAYTAAAFHGDDGQDLLMVDVDADEIFDVVTTLDGDIVANVENLGITVADAELQVTSDDPTYLASTDAPADDSYLDDIILV